MVSEAWQARRRISFRGESFSEEAYENAWWISQDAEKEFGAARAQAAVAGNETDEASAWDGRFGALMSISERIECNQFEPRNAPRIRIVEPEQVGCGKQFLGLPACGKCGCEFVNVGCPKVWPISTIVLTCAKCGSVVTYMDGLLIMSVEEALRETHGRDWVVRYRLALEISEKAGVHSDLVALALQSGMTLEEIAGLYDIEVSEDAGL